MIKVSLVRGVDPEHGRAVFPLFSSSALDREFEKNAESLLLPSVSKYVARLHPIPDSQYVLVNAMGAGEYYSSNINADHFPEAALIHCPDNWSGIPDVDKELSKNWPYGFPTFYNAHAFAHHRNKDPSRAYGNVELAAWNSRMKRVELIVRVDKDKCDRFGGTAVWDKLKLGMYPDVSMGSKVPFDTCSICLDWGLYRKAQATFDPKKHKYVGEAVLQFHKKLKAENGVGIRGLSITRNDYCKEMKETPNRILPDGRKVFVYNDYPRFFDISFVLIGADKTAKVMWKAASDTRVWSLPSAELAEKLGYTEDSADNLEKDASADEAYKLAFLGKAAKLKGAEIEKHGPASFDSKAVPLLTKSEPHIPSDVIDEMCQFPLSSIFSSTASMGIPLRPKEFQRIVIIKMGLRPVADELDANNVVFPKVDTSSSTALDAASIAPQIVRLLNSFFEARSALPPALDKRITVIVRQHKGGESKNPSSLPSKLLNKIGSAYTGYRKSLMDYWTQNGRNTKTASSLSQASFDYLKTAYWNEVGRL